jgi:hypothetical protein
LDVTVYNGLPSALPSLLAIISDMSAAIGIDREVAYAFFFGFHLLIIVVLWRIEANSFAG